MSGSLPTGQLCRYAPCARRAWFRFRALRVVHLAVFEYWYGTASVGLIDGQGENPRIMVEASYDGGRTWSAGTWARVGRLGEFLLKVKWDNMKTFYDGMLRISTSDPVNYSVFSANISLKLAGK